MSLEVLVHEWESCTLPMEIWQRHQTHLQVALWHLLTHPQPEAIERMRRGIQRYNASKGIPTTPTGGYHETLTVASMQLIAEYLANADRTLGEEQLVAGLIERFPSSTVLLEFYSRDRLLSVEARRAWLEPDLKPLRWT